MAAQLTLFCGLPGSGKTTLAKAMQAAEPGAIRLCTDDWLAELELDFYDESARGRLQTRLYHLGLELLQAGADVILEDGLWSKPERDEKLADARRVGAEVTIHVFDLSPAELWRRLDGRNQNPTTGQVVVPKHLLDEYWQRFELPTADELASFDRHVIHRDDTPPPSLNP